jgi:hypothetical protein
MLEIFLKILAKNNRPVGPVIFCVFLPAIAENIRTISQ